MVWKLIKVTYLSHTFNRRKRFTFVSLTLIPTKILNHSPFPNRLMLSTINHLQKVFPLKAIRLLTLCHHAHSSSHFSPRKDFYILLLKLSQANPLMCSKLSSSDLQFIFRPHKNCYSSKTMCCGLTISYYSLLYDCSVSLA